MSNASDLTGITITIATSGNATPEQINSALQVSAIVAGATGNPAAAITVGGAALLSANQAFINNSQNFLANPNLHNATAALGDLADIIGDATIVAGGIAFLIPGGQVSGFLAEELGAAVTYLGSAANVTKVLTNPTPSSTTQFADNLQSGISGLQSSEQNIAGAVSSADGTLESTAWAPTLTSLTGLLGDISQAASDIQAPQFTNDTASVSDQLDSIDSNLSNLIGSIAPVSQNMTVTPSGNTVTIADTSTEAPIAQGTFGSNFFYSAPASLAPAAPENTVIGPQTDGSGNLIGLTDTNIASNGSGGWTESVSDIGLNGTSSGNTTYEVGGALSIAAINGIPLSSDLASSLQAAGINGLSPLDTTLNSSDLSTAFPGLSQAVNPTSQATITSATTSSNGSVQLTADEPIGDASPMTLSLEDDNGTFDAGTANQTITVNNVQFDQNLNLQNGVLTASGAPAVTTSQQLSDVAEVGVTVGQTIADELISLALGNDIPADLVVQSLGNSAILAITQVLDDKFDLADPAEQLEADFGQDFADAVGGFAGSELGGLLAHDLGINSQIGSIIGGALGTATIQQVANDVAVSAGDQALFPEASFTGSLTTSLEGGLGAFAGSELAGLIGSQSLDASIGGDIGGSIGFAVGNFVFPVIGPFLGSFFGSFLGDIIGGLFGPGPPNPWSLGEVTLGADGQYYLAANYSDRITVTVH